MSKRNVRLNLVYVHVEMQWTDLDTEDEFLTNSTHACTPLTAPLELDMWIPHTFGEHAKLAGEIPPPTDEPE